MKINNLPKITIVTPSFNQGKFLRETIESVINQDYPNLEYFVVDGGSSDGSADIIREYDDRIDLWVSEKDNGQSDALNKGFEKATGELLCWVNSDDVLFPGCLQTVANTYLNKGRPDLIHADCVYMNEEGLMIRLYRVPRQTRFFMFRGVWSAPAPAVFFKASLFRKVGSLNTGYNLSMDLDIWMRMMQAGGQVAYIPEYLGAYRWHAGSQTSVAITVKKHRNDENPETRTILDAALKNSTEKCRIKWRVIWKIYQLFNFNYLRSFLETRRYRGKHWKQVFVNN